MRLKPTWLLLALWGMVAFLSYYRGQNLSETAEWLYVIAYYGAFLLTLGYLFWRIRQRRRE